MGVWFTEKWITSTDGLYSSNGWIIIACGLSEKWSTKQILCEVKSAQRFTVTHDVIPEGDSQDAGSGRVKITAFWHDLKLKWRVWCVGNWCKTFLGLYSSHGWTICGLSEKWTTKQIISRSQVKSSGWLSLHSAWWPFYIAQWHLYTGINDIKL